MHTYLFISFMVQSVDGAFYFSLSSLTLTLSLSLSFSFSLSFSDSLCMAPKRKTTPAWSPLHCKASSSDSTPLHFRFRDEKAHQDFLENFSKCGIHLEHHVILSDFSYIDLLTGHSQAGIRVSLWDLGELSLRDHTGVLLQYARSWLFHTSFHYFYLRYLYSSYSEAYVRCTTCSEGFASQLPWMFTFENCVQGQTTCKVEFIQLFCWLYFVPNLLVIQHLETQYLGGNHVRVVCERVCTQEGPRGWISRLASRERWHTCEACRGAEESRKLLHYKTKLLV